MPISINYYLNNSLYQINTTVKNGYANISLPEYAPDVEVDMYGNSFYHPSIGVANTTVLTNFVENLNSDNNTQELQNIKWELYRHYIKNSEDFSFDTSTSTYSFVGMTNLTWRDYSQCGVDNLRGYKLNSGNNVQITKQEVDSKTFNSDSIPLTYYSYGYDSDTHICSQISPITNVNKQEFLDIWINTLGKSWDSGSIPPGPDSFIGYDMNGVHYENPNNPIDNAINSFISDFQNSITSDTENLNPVPIYSKLGISITKNYDWDAMFRSSWVKIISSFFPAPPYTPPSSTVVFDQNSLVYGLNFDKIFGSAANLLGDLVDDFLDVNLLNTLKDIITNSQSVKSNSTDYESKLFCKNVCNEFK